MRLRWSLRETLTLPLSPKTGGSSPNHNPNTNSNPNPRSRLFTWGHGGRGRLGHGGGPLGEPEDVLEPREVGGALKWSEGGERIVSIAAGAIHTVVVTNTGTLPNVYPEPILSLS